MQIQYIFLKVHITDYVEDIEKPEEDLKTVISLPRDYCFHFGVVGDNVFDEFCV